MRWSKELGKARGKLRWSAGQRVLARLRWLMPAPEPYQMLGHGEWKKSADWFSERDIPYEKAVALTLGDTEANLEALAILDGLGADPLASKVRSRLKADGVTGIPRRSRGTANAGPLGLTARQVGEPWSA
jgi:hypothetical protein